MLSLAAEKKAAVLMAGLFVFSILAGPVPACCGQGSSLGPGACPAAGPTCAMALGLVALFLIVSLTLFFYLMFGFPFVPPLVYLFFRPPRLVSLP